jgi:hypothetical protein
MHLKILKFLLLVVLCFSISNCGIYRPTDARKVSPNDEERIKKNQKEGRGFTLGSLGKNSGGSFQFSSSNEMWRATLDILDFIPLSDVDYGGGIIVTEWYSINNNSDESIKIMVQFLSNEIRADGININVYKRSCKNQLNCSSSLVDSDIGSELKLEILKKAALIKKTDLEKK